MYKRQLFYSKGTGNYACYTSETTDKYLDEALAQPTVEESFDLWKKAQWDGQSGICLLYTSRCV